MIDLESTGNPAHVQLEGNVQRALGEAQAAADAAAAYSPSDPAAWTAPPPTTVKEALDRLAAVAASPP